MRAVSDSTTLFLGADRLRELLAHDPDVAMALLRSVSERAIKLLDLSIAA